MIQLWSQQHMTMITVLKIVVLRLLGQCEDSWSFCCKPFYPDADQCCSNPSLLLKRKPPRQKCRDSPDNTCRQCRRHTICSLLQNLCSFLRAKKCSWKKSIWYRLRIMMMADSQNKSFHKTAAKMWRDGGLAGMFRGNLTTVLKILPQTATQFAVRRPITDRYYLQSICTSCAFCFVDKIPETQICMWQKQTTSACPFDPKHLHMLTTCIYSSGPSATIHLKHGLMAL